MGVWMCNNSQACILISLFLRYVSHINVFLPSNSLSPPCLVCVCVCVSVCVSVCVCLRFLSHLFNCSHIQRRAAGNVSLSLFLSLFHPLLLLMLVLAITQLSSLSFLDLSLSGYKSPISFYHSVTISVLTTRG